MKKAIKLKVSMLFIVLLSGLILMASFVLSQTEKNQSSPDPILNESGSGGRNHIYNDRITNIKEKMKIYNESRSEFKESIEKTSITKEGIKSIKENMSLLKKEEQTREDIWSETKPTFRSRIGHKVLGINNTNNESNTKEKNKNLITKIKDFFFGLWR